MRPITKEMIKLYRIKEFDFMGYTFVNNKELSFHHLIIPRRLNGLEIIENGAILVQSTSHDYLHTIERIDYDMFMAITSEMIDENLKGYLDMQNIRQIADILRTFEKDYCHLRNKHHESIIKDKYIRRRILK